MLSFLEIAGTILKALGLVKWAEGFLSAAKEKRDARKVQDVVAAPADNPDDVLRWLGSPTNDDDK